MSVQTPETVEIGEAVIFQSLQDEAVILNMTNQEYYNLNDVGTRMWNLLLEHRDVETVVSKLKDVYDVDEDRLRADVHALVQELVAADLLKTAPDAPVTAA